MGKQELEATGHTHTQSRAESNELIMQQCFGQFLLFIQSRAYPLNGAVHIQNDPSHFNEHNYESPS